MPELSDVSKHYAHGDLIEAIRSGLTLQGKSMHTVTIDELAPVDEFHIGGRRASEDFLDQLAFDPQTKVLDVGCGLGGSARFVADRYGSQVTGKLIDEKDEHWIVATNPFDFTQTIEIERSTTVLGNTFASMLIASSSIVSSTGIPKISCASSA